MLLAIQHSTILRYSRPISESVLEVRVTPRSDSRQTLRQFHLSVGPDARVTSHLDWLGNPVHQFSVLAPHDRVVVHATSTVETHAARTEPSRLVDLLVADTPRHRLHDWLSFQGPVTRDARLVELAERLRLGQCARVIDAVEVVTARTRDVLEYRRGMTHAASSVSEALDAGAGVCQDFAHVGVALLRLAGVPARYVSGYLHRRGAPEVETHAWCEAFFPSAGWVGLDPTHGSLVGESHVAVAAGRSYADVPPNRGVYRGESEEVIGVTVTIEELAAVPEAIGFEGAPAAVLAGASAVATAIPSLALEQQFQQDRARAQVQQQRQQQQ